MRRMTVMSDALKCLPDGEVIVLVVYQRRNTAVRIVLRVFWFLVLARREVQVFTLVCQAELFKYDDNLPVEK